MNDRVALLQEIRPCVALQQYVRKFNVFKFVFEKGSHLPPKFHAPRPEHSITFYVRDAQKFSHLHSDEIITYPSCVINGIYDTPIYRHGGYDFWAIKTVLQPTTLARLKVVNVSEITNRYLNAEDFLGKEVSLLSEKLAAMGDLPSMIQAIEQFLIMTINRRVRIEVPFDKATCAFFNLVGNKALEWYADQACLSLRQFIRQFEEQVGISPKTFQKIIRFDKACRMKNNHPQLDWLQIAISCNYYDYQHLSKDFKEFTQMTPPAFYEIEKTSPERSFALHES